MKYEVKVGMNPPDGANDGELEMNFSADMGTQEKFILLIAMLDKLCEELGTSIEAVALNIVVHQLGTEADMDACMQNMREAHHMDADRGTEKDAL